MKRLYDFETKEESFDEMIKGERIMPFLKIFLQDAETPYSTILPATKDDAICIFKEEDQIYILTRNPEHERVVFEIASKGQRLGGICLRGENIKEILGKRDLPPTTIIKRLKNIFFKN